MGDNRFSCNGGIGSAARESFGIETNRILDACRDRDCFEDTRVFLTCVGENLINRTGNVRVKCAEIVGSNIAVDPVQFSCGFYSVQVKFYVRCKFEVCVPLGQAQEFEGIAVVEKRVVLFGGESNVSVFRSHGCESYCAIPEPVCCALNTPEAVIEVVQPIVLGARIVESVQECHCCCCCCDVPTVVSDSLNGALNDGENERYLTISLGLFSVIRLVRAGQLLVQASEYSIPDKECCAPDENDPCGTFRSMPFPTAEFCPNQVAPVSGNNGRGSRCCGNS
ncbi:MAG: hypothetical protein E7663_00840 [Ruminococcaceae bacterium]|nr:hypothetical protein [Oscillospiraceae bacterium]